MTLSAVLHARRVVEQHATMYEHLIAIHSRNNVSFVYKVRAAHTCRCGAADGLSEKSSGPTRDNQNDHFSMQNHPLSADALRMPIMSLHPQQHMH